MSYMKFGCKKILSEFFEGEFETPFPKLERDKKKYDHLIEQARLESVGNEETKPYDQENNAEQESCLDNNNMSAEKDENEDDDDESENANNYQLQISNTPLNLKGMHNRQVNQIKNSNHGFKTFNNSNYATIIDANNNCNRYQINHEYYNNEDSSINLSTLI